MSETECQYCGGRYTYFAVQVKPDGTVSCQNCGRAIKNPTIVRGEPKVERGTPFLQWLRASGCVYYATLVLTAIILLASIRVLQSGTVTGEFQSILFILIVGLVTIGTLVGSKINRIRQYGRHDQHSTT